MSIQKTLKELFPDLTGSLEIFVNENTVFLNGNIHTTANQKEVNKELMSLITEKYNNPQIIGGINVSQFSVLEENEFNTNKVTSPILDEVDIKFYGMVNTNVIKHNDEFKLINYNNKDKIDNVVKVLNFISPIVVDTNLQVIDGNLRLLLAKENNIPKVPIIVVGGDKKKTDFLRLSLNRSSEFQRWNYREVDDYVDNTPQVQPIAEPLGFPGKNVLPTSYFSNTVVNYIIDPFSEKQKQYSQEEGLAEWAEYRRAQMAKLSEEKRKPKKKKANVVSLFDLVPKEEDFLETYDIDEEMKNHVDKYKDIANNITNVLDERKKAELELTGKAWQVSHLSSAEVAARNRQQAIEYIEQNEEYTSEEKEFMINNIELFAEIYKDINKSREFIGEHLS